MKKYIKISFLGRLLGQDTVNDFKQMASDLEIEIKEIKDRKKRNSVAFRKKRAEKRCLLNEHRVTGGNDDAPNTRN